MMSYDECVKEIRSVTMNSAQCSDKVIGILHRHKCLYLLSQIKKDISNNSCYVIVNQLIQQYQYSECRLLFNELEKIQYVVMKGAVLSKRIYGKPNYRICGDIDLLIAPKDRELVTQILYKHGFVQGKIRNNEVKMYTREEKMYHKLYTHQLASFEKKINFPLCTAINIDVNFDIFWGESYRSVNIEEYLTHTESSNIFDVKIQELSLVYEFIALCLHHYKDMNSIYLLSERGICLNEFCDIYYYIINTGMDACELDVTAKAYQVEAYVYYCIYYANEIFGDNRLNEFLEKLVTSEGKMLLDCYGLNEDERKKWDIPFLERVFSEEFRECFRGRLSVSDLKKIEINKKYMYR